jgi:hypothetical protein
MSVLKEKIIEIKEALEPKVVRETKIDDLCNWQKKKCHRSRLD